MHDKGTCDPVAEDNRSDWGVLMTLLAEDQRPWTVAELIRNHGDALAAEDSIARLQRGGLIHRTQDDLLYPSRAAIYFDQIAS